MEAFEQYNEIIDALLDFIDDHERGLTKSGRGDIVNLLYEAEKNLVKAHEEMVKDAFI